MLTSTRLVTDLEGAAVYCPHWPLAAGAQDKLLRGAVGAVDLAADLAADSPSTCPHRPTTSRRRCPGGPPASWLRELAAKAPPATAPRRSTPGPGRCSATARVIRSLGFPGCFLIVHAIVEFCAQSEILPREGSAASSAVCYALGILADAVRHQMLFERFLSRGEPATRTSTSTSRPAAAKRSSASFSRYGENVP